MANMTLSIPDNMHADMKNFSEIRWSEVARKAIAEKLDTLKTVEALMKKSNLSQKDVNELDRMIKKKAARKFLA